MVELRERAGGEGERAGGEGESRREGERDGGKIKDPATPQEKEKHTVIEVQRGTDVLVHQDDVVTEISAWARINSNQSRVFPSLSKLKRARHASQAKREESAVQHPQKAVQQQTEEATVAEDAAEEAREGRWWARTT